MIENTYYTIIIVDCRIVRTINRNHSVACWLYIGCVLVSRWWDQYRYLGEWSYGWTYCHYFDHTVGRVGGHVVGLVVGRSDVMDV